MNEWHITLILSMLWVLLRLRRVAYWTPVFLRRPGWQQRVNHWRSVNPEEAVKIERREGRDV